jgi:hypothetical protein
MILRFFLFFCSEDLFSVAQVEYGAERRRQSGWIWAVDCFDTFPDNLQRTL